MEHLREKEFYRKRIVEMVGKIGNPKILHCIYIFVYDIMKEDVVIAKENN